MFDMIDGTVAEDPADFDDDAELQKAAGVNINLWAGIGMLVVAALFFTWAQVRPLVVPAETEAEETTGTTPAAGE